MSSGCADSGSPSTNPSDADGSAHDAITPDMSIGSVTADATSVTDDANQAENQPPSDGGAKSDWFDLSYSRRRRLSFDARLASIDGGALTDVPVALVVPPDTIDGASVRSDGGDLRFVDATGRALNHDVEAWDPHGTSVVWVVVPTVPLSPAVPIFLYYGSPLAAPVAGDRENAWKAPYAAVWHFAGNAEDATKNHHHGTVIQASFAAGKLGQAAKFDAPSRNHIGLASGAAITDSAEAVTESAWVKTAAIDPSTWGVVLGIGTSAATGDLSRTSLMIWGKTATYPYGGQIMHDAIYGEINPDEAAGAWAFAYSPGEAVPAAAWHYVTVVFDVKGKSTSVYNDGVLVGGPLLTPGQGGAAGPGAWKAAAFAGTPSGRVQIGAEEDVTHGFFDGLIDELRVEIVARPASWISAQTVAASGSAITLGAEERP